MNFHSEHDCTATLSSACVPIMSDMRKTSGKYDTSIKYVIDPEKEKKGESARVGWRSGKGKEAIVVLLLRLRTSAIFLVASLLFRNFARKCKDLCEWSQLNTIATQSIFQKCITIKTSSAWFWKVPVKTQKEVEVEIQKQNSSMCLQCFGYATGNKILSIFYEDILV